MIPPPSHGHLLAIFYHQTECNASRKYSKDYRSISSRPERIKNQNLHIAFLILSAEYICNEVHVLSGKRHRKRHPRLIDMDCRALESARQFSGEAYDAAWACIPEGVRSGNKIRTGR
jgi:hypothetical protein